MEVNISDKERAGLGEDLYTVGAMVGTAHVALMGLEIIAHRGGFDFSPIKTRTEEIIDLLGQATEKYRAISGTLYRARIPVSPDSAPMGPKANDLAMITTMGTEDSRELLELLEKAQAVAERIDASRGFVVDEKIPLHPGESRGTDLAESVSVLALRARREAQGGQSRHE
jgi:hypothetical protein